MREVRGPRNAPGEWIGTRYRRRKPGRLLLLGLLATLLLAFVPHASAASRVVRVGIYENEPKVFTDESGTPSGIFVDLIERIAADEGWEIEYVPAEWADDIAALEAGRIDLMPDVAYTPERDETMDFHKIPIAESWSYVYSAPGQTIDRVSQLEGKRVAVLEGSVQQDAFAEMIAGFSLDTEIVAAGSLSEAFEMASSGAADAAIANYFFGDYFYREYGLERTPIVFNAVPLYFATGQGRNADLLEAIDEHMGAWIDDGGSYYYDTLGRYTADARSRGRAYLTWSLVGVVGLLVVASGIILLLRWQVRVRTAHLLETQTELQRHRDQLGLMVEQATAQLQRANIELEAASTAKNAFLARMSHELRTPLNSIIGFSEVMGMGMSGPLNEEQSRQVAMISQSGKHLLVLINEILDLSKVESGSMQVTAGEFDAAALVTELVESVAVQADEHGIAVEAELPDGPVMVTSDERIVRQIMLNLIGNAIKFTREGGVRVGVRVSSGGIEFSVQDTGIGIAQEHLPHIFDEFWQVTDIEGGDGTGTGLGLAISSAMAARIGGRLRVDSVLGEGSTFRLELPPSMPEQ